MAIKNTISVMSGKGGVGKSTIAALIANKLSKKYKVGLLDIDIHGPNIPLLFGIGHLSPEQKEGKIQPIEHNHLKLFSTLYLLPERNKAIIWRGPLKHKLINDFLNLIDWGNLDYLIVDFPPGTGDEILSFAQLIKNYNSKNYGLIISMPQQMSLLDAERSIDFCKKMNLDILGIIENMSGSIFGKDKVKIIASNHNIDYLGSLELSEKLIKLSQEGKIDSYENEIINIIVENIINKTK